MPILSKPRKPATTAIPDWTADPRVRRLAEREADLARQAAEAALALEAAIAARAAAQATLDAATDAYLTGATGDRHKVDVARLAVEAGATAPAAAQRLVEDVARERTRLAELRPAVEAEAKADARAAFMEIYHPAVAQLLAAVEAAHTSNVIVQGLWTAARRSGLEVRALAWLSLLRRDDPAASASPTRSVGDWEQAAAQFLGRKGS
jgi:hypothetical protein